MYPSFFYLCVGLYQHGINHLSFSIGTLRVHTRIHFLYSLDSNWRYTYSVRLFLLKQNTDTRYIGKLHRCKGIYTKCKKYIHQAFSFCVTPSSSRWIRSSAINERNVCTSSTDHETAIFWLIQKGPFVQTKFASDPSLAVRI